MNTSDYNAVVGRILYDLAILKETHISPGEILALVRTANKIPATALADILQISVSELNDIESGRAPFPTILLMLIFVYGLPAWYHGMTD